MSIQGSMSFVIITFVCPVRRSKRFCTISHLPECHRIVCVRCCLVVCVIKLRCKSIQRESSSKWTKLICSNIFSICFFEYYVDMYSLIFISNCPPTLVHRISIRFKTSHVCIPQVANSFPLKFHSVTLFEEKIKSFYHCQYSCHV